MIPGMRCLLLAAVCTTGAVSTAYLSLLPVRAAETAAGPASQRQTVQLAGGTPSIGRYVGAGSCAAASCHGGESGPDRNEPKKLSEYAVWVQNDPHATAYSVLYNRRSQQIAHNLGLKDGAHKSALCTNCHSLTAVPLDARLPPRHILEDGVSCEACHGPASEWLSEHTRADWKYRTADQKALLGFRDTKDVKQRTAACVQCHIGGTGRDVDHDLIAAGHPRLYFEMAAYHEKMPHHWSRKADRNQNQVSEARLWLVGQFACAAGSLELLEYRASSTKPNVVWPEFAESACFACHHDLSRPGKGGPSWRQQRPQSGRADDFPWGSWHFALVTTAARQLAAGADADALEKDLQELRRLMAEPRPDRAKVVAAAARLRAGLQPLTASANDRRTFSEAEIRQALAALLDSADSPVKRDWDGATQVYLGIVALAQTLREEPAAGGAFPAQGPVFDQLRGMRDRLQFPRTEFQIRYSSPADFDARRIDQLTGDLQRLRELFQTN